MTTTNTSLDSSIPSTDHSPSTDQVPYTGYPPPPAPPTGDGYPPPPMPAPRRRKGGTAAMIVGAVLVGSGFLTAVSGGALLGLFGAGQQLSSGEYPVSTFSSALVADLGQIDGTHALDVVTGTPTLHLSAENINGSGVFIGVAPTDDVTRYLQGVATDRVTGLEVSPLHLSTERNEGTGTARPPADQTFWVATGESANQAQLTWEIQDGRYQVVVMNADGSAGILTSAEIGTSLPGSTGLWIAVLSFGVLIMIGGGSLMFVGARRGRDG